MCSIIELVFELTHYHDRGCAEACQGVVVYYLCWRCVVFWVSLREMGWWGGLMSPIQVPHAGFPPLCFVSREYDGCLFSFPRFRVPDRVRRRVGGMRVEPRFRGLMARTVLLVYTLFELLGSCVRLYQRWQRHVLRFLR